MNNKTLLRKNIILLFGIIAFLAIGLFLFRTKVNAQENVQTKTPEETQKIRDEIMKSTTTLSNNGETDQNMKSLPLDAVPTNGMDESKFLAWVNVSSFKIISQDGNNFKLSFEMRNEKLNQPGARYGVLLSKKGIKDEFIYNKVYDEILELSVNETVKRDIEFQAPEFLSGEYVLNFFSYTTGGLILGYYPIDATLDGNNQYFEVSDCFFEVEGDSIKYGISSGVDVLPSEKLTGKCQVENKFGKDMTFQYSFDYYQRSIFGKKVAEGKNSSEEIILKSGEKKEVFFPIELMEKPQAYDAILKLKGQDTKVISNETIFHYVMRGPSALMQNIRFDKDYYSLGEEANIKAFWSLSADSFFGSRSGSGTKIGEVFFEGEILNGSNNKCSNTFRQSLGANIDEQLDLKIPITNDCANPILVVKITDKDNKVLDESQWKMESNSVPDKKVKEERQSQNKSKLYILIFFAILLAVLIILIAYKKFSHKIYFFTFLFFILSIFLFGAHFSSAATVRITFSTDFDTLDKTVYFSISGAPICPGGNINLNTWQVSTRCGNGRPNSGTWIGEADYAYYNRPGIDAGWVPWGRYGYTLNSPLTVQGSSNIGNQGVSFYVYAELCICADGGNSPSAADCGMKCWGGGAPSGNGWGTTSESYQVIGPPAAPTGPTHSCSPAGDSVTISWNAAANASNYLFRFDDLTSCNLTNCAAPCSGDFCDSNAGTSRTITVVPGRSYNWWVHANNACGYSGAVNDGSFSCPPPSPVTYTIRSKPVCASGTLDPNFKTRMWTISGPLDSGDAAAAGQHSYTWNTTATHNFVCWGMDDGTATGNLIPVGTSNPPTSNIFYTCWSGIAAEWFRDILPGGTYDIDFKAPASACIPACSPVPGACGTAAGTSACVAPVANLCALGSTASVVTTSGGVASWTCTGACGGTVQPCTATVTPFVVGSCPAIADRCVGNPPVPTCAPGGGTPSGFLTTAPWSWTCDGSCGGASPTCNVGLKSPGAFNYSCQPGPSGSCAGLPCGSVSSGSATCQGTEAVCNTSTIGSLSLCGGCAAQISAGTVQCAPCVGGWKEVQP
jgi:hypothetical protein